MPSDRFLKDDLERIQEDLVEFDEAREKLLESVRSATRLAGLAIIQTHRGQFPEADGTLKKAQKILKEIDALLLKSPQLHGTGNPQVAYQEYVEAKLLYHLSRDKKIPSVRQIQVGFAAYLLGLLDFVGELRRRALNFLRIGKTEEAEVTLELMEGIYESLYSLDHATIIPNFRHKLDAARKIIESTRGDVVTDVRKIALEKAIKGLEKKLQ